MHGSWFQAHDAFATASQGTIQDRKEEHLVSSDKAIIAARKLLEKAIRDVQEEGIPPTWPGSPAKPLSSSIGDLGMIPNASDWKDYTKALELEARESCHEALQNASDRRGFYVLSKPEPETKERHNEDKERHDFQNRSGINPRDYRAGARRRFVNQVLRCAGEPTYGLADFRSRKSAQRPPPIGINGDVYGGMRAPVKWVRDGWISLTNRRRW